jgi:probable F420-dependent oxidoreductase
MRIGAIFPTSEIGTDPIAIRDFAQAVEEMGFDHLLVFDHVLGADTSTRPGWQGYTYEDPFHEPFVLLGYLAALTQRLELVTGVLILPQRQTALVAKQAAELDGLSKGRLRLGIGVGWNRVEYEALGEDFHERGARSEEQIAMLRALWTQPVVTFQGRWHHIDHAGLNPLPIQRPIPVWLGGHAEGGTFLGDPADTTLQRIARLGDGWIALQDPNDEMRRIVERLRTYVREAGRTEQAVGIEGWLNLAATPEAQWLPTADAWRRLGATHLSLRTSLRTQRLGPSAHAHIEALRRARAAIGT